MREHGAGAAPCAAGFAAARRPFPRRFWQRVRLLLDRAEGEVQQVVEVPRVVSLIVEQYLRKLDGSLPPFDTKIAASAILHGTLAIDGCSRTAMHIARAINRSAWGRSLRRTSGFGGVLLLAASLVGVGI